MSERDLPWARTIEQTIAKLKANGFQYASAGDARRLIAHIARLEARVKELEELVAQSNQILFGKAEP
jgi:hypothetical protein